MAEDTVEKAIEDSAKGPQSARTDMGEVQQHPLKDQIEADKYLTGKQAVTRKRRGLRFSILQPPGA